MNEIFIERNIFFKFEESFDNTCIRVYKPINISGEMICHVSFSKLEKYNAKLKGADEFNAVECAFSYIMAVCANSDDPEFFIKENESMKNFDG